MAERTPTASPAYGTPNWEMIGRWFELPPEQDTPFWAVNLMKYKARADYGDDGDRGRSGKEADDAYTPLGPLAAIGATVAFAGDVVEQWGSQPTWDRVGIVRYPNRAAFFAMQQRDDFKDQHAHKEAGMDVTIVLSCLPIAKAPLAATPADGHVVVRVRRFADGGRADETLPEETLPEETLPEGATALCRLAVEGVIVGDDRTWDEVRFDHAVDDAALGALLQAVGDAEAFTLVLDPLEGADHLVESIRTAGAVPAREA